MARATKPPEKTRACPRAKTLRPGTYRLVMNPAQAVVIKPVEIARKRQADFNETDWYLAMVDAVWEKAEVAYYAGLDQGFALGLQQGRSEVEKNAQHLRRTLETLELRLLEFFSGLENWSVRLSLALAEKVIGKAAQQHEELVKHSIRSALQEAADKSRLLVRVHPADYEVMKTYRAELTALSEGIEHFKIEADLTVTPGGCRIETPSGLLDADLNVQIGELRRCLKLSAEMA